jgi:hypothetical protein
LNDLQHVGLGRALGRRMRAATATIAQGDASFRAMFFDL